VLGCLVAKLGLLVYSFALLRCRCSNVEGFADRVQTVWRKAGCQAVWKQSDAALNTCAEVADTRGT
jgi:hypothetical protein